MLMVIFGAGATFDSVYPGELSASTESFAPAVHNPTADVSLRDDDHPDRPPQAKGLIDLRRRFGGALEEYGACRPLVMGLRRIFEAGEPFDIEQELEKIQTVSEQEPHRLPQLTAFRFYLRKIIREVTADWSRQQFRFP